MAEWIWWGRVWVWGHGEVELEGLRGVVGKDCGGTGVTERGWGGCGLDVGGTGVVEWGGGVTEWDC